MISTAAGPVRRNRHAARIPVSEKGLVRFASILVQSDAVRKLRTHGWFAVGMFLILAFPALAGEKKIIAGYFPQWGVYTRNYHVTNVPAARISHLIYAFAKPVYDELDDAGSVVSSDIIADLENLYPGDTTNQPVRGNFNQLARLKNIYPHLRTLISVGGWTLSDDFSDIAASSNARSTFAASAVSFMTNYGFDGIDLDWEFPVSGGKQGMMHRPEDDNNYVLLSAAIRLELDRQATIHGRPYLLTATGGAAYTSVTNRYRLAEMAAYLDWFNVMAYNYSGDWSALSGHGAPLYANPAAEVPDFNIDRTVQAYFDAGVAPEKMVLGMSFVGFGLKEVGTNAGGLFQPLDIIAFHRHWAAGNRPQSFDNTQLNGAQHFRAHGPATADLKEYVRDTGIVAGRSQCLFGGLCIFKDRFQHPAGIRILLRLKRRPHHRLLVLRKNGGRVNNCGFYFGLNGVHWGFDNLFHLDSDLDLS